MTSIRQYNDSRGERLVLAGEPIAREEWEALDETWPDLPDEGVYREYRGQYHKVLFSDNSTKKLDWPDDTLEPFLKRRKSIIQSLRELRTSRGEPAFAVTDPPRSAREISPLQFLMRLEKAERVAIWRAAQQDDDVADSLAQLSVAHSIQLDDPRIIQALDGLVQKDLLSEKSRNRALSTSGR